MALHRCFSPGLIRASVVFTANTAVETEFAADTTPWDLTVSMAADDNAVFVAFGSEAATATISSVVLDPGGGNETALSLVTSAANGATKVWIYGAWGFSGISGSKTLRITPSTAFKGMTVHNTFKGAANAEPTPEDTDASAGATSLANNLAAPNADGVVLVVGSTNSTNGALTGGVTEVGSRIDGTNIFTIKVGRKVGSLSNPETPGMSQSAGERIVVCSCVVNPA